MNDETVCRKAPATPGLLNIQCTVHSVGSVYSAQYSVYSVESPMSFCKWFCHHILQPLNGAELRTETEHQSGRIDIFGIGLCPQKLGYILGLLAFADFFLIEKIPLNEITWVNTM